MFGTSKKFYAFALVAVLLLALVVVVAAGCGSSTTTTTAAAVTTTAAAATTTTAAGGTTTTAASTSTTLLDNTGKLTGKKVLIVSQYLAVAAGREQVETLISELKKAGAVPTLVDAGGDADKLVTLFEQGISQKYDIIVNGAIPTNMLGSAITDAKSAGIPVFVSNGQPDANEVASVHQNAVDMETQLATIFVNAINQKGNVVLATQSDDWLILQISDTIRSIIAKYPDIKVLQDIHPDHSNDVATLKTDMTAILTANPTPGSVAGGIAAWGDPAAGMAQAAEDANRTELKIVGSDGIEAECEQMLLPKPVEIATMHQNWPVIENTLVGLMAAYEDGSNKTYGQDITVPSELIDSPALAQGRLTFLQNFIASLSTTTT